MKYPKYFPDVVGTRKSPLDSFIIAVSPLDLVLFQKYNTETNKQEKNEKQKENWMTSEEIQKYITIWRQISNLYGRKKI